MSTYCATPGVVAVPRPTAKNSHRLTAPKIRARKGGQKICALTAYDYTTAVLLDRAGIDFVLVGDSAACIVQGEESTISITLEEMLYHCRCVARGVSRALVVGDLPFLSYQISDEQAVLSAGRMLKEGRVGAVKLEGGERVAARIAACVQCEIPVMAHIGLTPQSFHRMGGHTVQGRSAPNVGSSSREQVLQDALAVERAGAFAVVLEGIPADLAVEITSRLEIPTIGIGAGASCDGQILVTHDMLGLTAHQPPRFVKQFAALGALAERGIEQFMKETRSGEFPAAEHSFSDSTQSTPALLHSSR